MWVRKKKKEKNSFFRSLKIGVAGSWVEETSSFYVERRVWVSERGIYTKHSSLSSFIFLYIFLRLIIRFHEIPKLYTHVCACLPRLSLSLTHSRSVGWDHNPRALCVLREKGRRNNADWMCVFFFIFVPSLSLSSHSYGSSSTESFVLSVGRKVVHGRGKRVLWWIFEKDHCCCCLLFFGSLDRGRRHCRRVLRRRAIS